MANSILRNLDGERKRQPDPDALLNLTRQYIYSLPRNMSDSMPEGRDWTIPCLLS